MTTLELLNTDATAYGGSGLGNLGGVDTEGSPWHGRTHSLRLTLPPLSTSVFKLRTDGQNPPAA